MNPQQLAVVLVRPKVSANVGAVCRLVKNFRLGPLRLVNPEPLKESRIRSVAHGALDVWAAHTQHESLDDALGDARWVVGATRRSGKFRPVHYDPNGFAEKLAQHPEGEEAALVFGPEEAGLAAEEIERCHALVEIEQFSHQPSLNLSHAVSILAYNIHLASLSQQESNADDERPPAPRPATQRERALLVERMMAQLDRTEYPDYRRERFERALRGFFNRPFIQEPDIRVFQQWLAHWESVLERSGEEE